MKEITSISNTIIQSVRALKDKSSRYERQEFIVEGANIIKDLPKDISVCSLFVEKSKLDEFSSILKNFNEDIIYVVSSKVMSVLSDTKTPQGILLVAKMKSCTFDNTSCVILDGVSDPGNMGTIIRTCVACDIKNIILINTVDPYSMKVVRSSMGGIFRVNTIFLSAKETLNLLKDFEILALDMNGENIYDINKINKKFALVVGSEAHGISKEFEEGATKVIKLPMKGDIESLNASIALSISLYHITNTLTH